jgi:hypothetical protein
VGIGEKHFEKQFDDDFDARFHRREGQNYRNPRAFRSHEHGPAAAALGMRPESSADSSEALVRSERLFFREVGFSVTDS